MKKSRKTSVDVSVHGNMDGNIIVGNNNQVTISTNKNRDETASEVNLRLEEYYRTALNWDKKTKLREFDLSHRNLESIDLSNADLIRANLSYANLCNAKLQNANLQGAILTGANFENAILAGANFHESNVTTEQLRLAQKLRKVKLPDGKLYDGRFNLKADIDECQNEAYVYGSTVKASAILIATLSHIFYPPEVFAANWFGISKDEYLSGQKWASENGIEPFIPYYSTWLKH